MMPFFVFKALGSILYSCNQLFLIFYSLEPEQSCWKAILLKELRIKPSNIYHKGVKEQRS